MGHLRNPGAAAAFLFVTAVTFGAASAANATDVTGHWRLESNTGSTAGFFDLQQTGNVVTFPAGLFSPLVDTAIDITLTADSGSFFNFNRLGVRVLAGGRIIDAGGFDWPLYGTGVRFFLTRCECFDGNETSGDGCDAECRVEPCYSCAGDPSDCTPLADGAACNDHLDCNSGETCSVGTCGGGSPVPSCIDMTGRWQIETVSDTPVYPIEDTRDVQQRDGIVIFRHPSDGGLAEVGVVDPATGALDLVTARVEGYAGIPFPEYRNSPPSSCSQVDFTGAVAADGESFAGSGSGIFAEATRTSECDTSESTFSRTGRRCGAGECLYPADSCPPCMARNDLGGCATGPRRGCLRSLDPSRSSLRLQHNAAIIRDRFKWTWRDGEAATAGSFGNVARATGMQICVFDESGVVPSVVYEAYWNPVGNIPPWDVKGPFDFRRKMGSMEQVKFTPGADGQTGLIVNGRGGSLSWNGLALGVDGLGVPAAPFGLPLRVQAQMDMGGACFESTFDSARHNKRGLFNAAATQ